MRAWFMSGGQLTDTYSVTTTLISTSREILIPLIVVCICGVIRGFYNFLEVGLQWTAVYPHTTEFFTSGLPC
jgi:hypothetical protein